MNVSNSLFSFLSILSEDTPNPTICDRVTFMKWASYVHPEQMFDLSHAPESIKPPEINNLRGYLERYSRAKKVT